MQRKSSGGALTRVLTACVVAPALMFLVWQPGLHLVFSLVIAAFAGIGLYEYHVLARSCGVPSARVAGIAAGTAIAVSGHWGSPAAANGLLFAGCLLASAFHLSRRQCSLAGLGASVFGLVYVGWLAAHINLLRSAPGIGPGLVTVLFAGVFLNDSGAYVVGSLFGRHKLAPVVSPKKTWEGAFGGIAVALLSMAALYWFRNHLGWRGLPGWDLPRYLVIGAALAVVGQVGDLVESCLKRDAGAKDSGVIFPGHGGVLDRCDGLLFAAPVLYNLTVFWK